MAFLLYTSAMKKNIMDYIKEFEKILNFSDISWWIIDCKNDPDHFHCNKLMKETFMLNKQEEKHSIKNTCPIVGDSQSNIRQASSSGADIIINEYLELLNNKRSEFNNSFPYFDARDKKIKYFSSRAKILEYDEKGNVSMIFGILEEITHKVIQEKEIKEYHNIIDKFVMTSTTNTRGIVTDVTQAFCDTSGYTKDELIGKEHSIVKHPDTPREVYRDMWKTISAGQTWEGELKNLRKDGSYYWIYLVISPNFNEMGHIKGYTTINQNITDKKIVERLSNRDKLTAVYNRAKLDVLLEKELSYVNRYHTELSIIMMDIDYFKLINDDYGHLEGDKVLVAIAQILKDLTRQTDYIGRWGGEEFLIICPNSNINQGEIVAKKLKENIENFNFNIERRITASFGITSYKKGDKSEDLLLRADQALYKAKENGRNRIEIIKDC